MAQAQIQTYSCPFRGGGGLTGLRWANRGQAQPVSHHRVATPPLASHCPSICRPNGHEVAPERESDIFRLPDDASGTRCPGLLDTTQARNAKGALNSGPGNETSRIRLSVSALSCDQRKGATHAVGGMTIANANQLEQRKLTKSRWKQGALNSGAFEVFDGTSIRHRTGRMECASLGTGTTGTKPVLAAWQDRDKGSTIVSRRLPFNKSQN